MTILRHPAQGRVLARASRRVRAWLWLRQQHAPASVQQHERILEQKVRELVSKLQQIESLLASDYLVEPEAFGFNTGSRVGLIRGASGQTTSGR